jgi:hypothetical protein
MKALSKPVLPSYSHQISFQFMDLFFLLHFLPVIAIPRQGVTQDHNSCTIFYYLSFSPYSIISCYVRVNKREAMSGVDPHPCRQLTGNTLSLTGRTTPSLKRMTNSHLPQGLSWLSNHLLLLLLAIVNLRKFSLPAKLPLQTPVLYLLQVCKQQWVLALARYSPLQGFFLNQPCAGV